MGGPSEALGREARGGRWPTEATAHVYAAQLSIDGGAGDASGSGSGVAGEIACGFTPRLAAFLALGGAAMEPENGGDGYGLGTGDLGLRFNLRPSARLNPYLQVAVTGQVALFDVPRASADLAAEAILAGVLHLAPRAPPVYSTSQSTVPRRSTGTSATNALARASRSSRAGARTTNETCSLGKLRFSWITRPPWASMSVR